MFKDCQVFADSLISKLSQLLIAVLFMSAAMALPASPSLTGAILLQIFIGFLLFMRARRKLPLFILPDEILVALPYLWSVSLLGAADHWLKPLLLPMLLAFALSFLQVIDGNKGFKGGLAKNSLLQAIALSVMFVVLMLTFLLKVFPVFSIEIYRRVILQLFTVGAGIPISLSAFYWLLAGGRRLTGIND